MTGTAMAGLFCALVSKIYAGGKHKADYSWQDLISSGSGLDDGGGITTKQVERFPPLGWGGDGVPCSYF